MIRNDNSPIEWKMTQEYNADENGQNSTGATFECSETDGNGNHFTADLRWGSCVDLRADDSYFHICNLPRFIKMLQELEEHRGA